MTHMLKPFDQLSRNAQLRRLKAGDLDPPSRLGKHGNHRTNQATHDHPWIRRPLTVKRAIEMQNTAKGVN